MERITQTQLDNAVRHLNTLLPAKVSVFARGRNGGTALDHCYLEDGKATWQTSRTLVFGTKREVYDFVRAMREGILLSHGQ